LLPVTSIGSFSFPAQRCPLVLNNVLVSPSIIKNLISVHRFTTDNNCSIEFDPFGLSVKDLQTRSVIARCNSTGDLYPFFPPTNSIPALAAPTSTSTLWHCRLGHIGSEAMSKLISSHAVGYPNQGYLKPPRNPHHKTLEKPHTYKNGTPSTALRLA
jgi:hypothetical protein